jgi:hypothetical protein
LLAAVVLTPAVSNRSFNAMGMPWSGPRTRPAAISFSAARASASACSPVTVMNAFHLGFSFSMRSRHACVNATGDTFLLFSIAPACSIVCQ